MATTTHATPCPADQPPPREHPAWWLAACTLLAALAGLCFYPWSA